MTNRPTRISEIRARLKAATPGPWQYDEKQRRIFVQEPCPGEHCFDCDGGPTCCGFKLIVETDSGYYGQGKDDERFLAHAPTDIEWLLGEVERLQNRQPLRLMDGLAECEGCGYPSQAVQYVDGFSPLFCENGCGPPEPAPGCPDYGPPSEDDDVGF